MLSKVIGLCVVVIVGNAVGMKVSSQMSDVSSKVGARIVATASAGTVR